jgi:hypothetical protein
MTTSMSSQPLAGRVAIAVLAVIGTVLATSDPFTFLSFVAYMSVGAILVVLRPRNVVGWLLILMAFAFIGTTTPRDLDLAAVLRGEGSARDRLIVWIGGWAGLTSYLAFLALTIAFPNGRLPERGRRLSLFMLVVSVVVIVLTAIAPTVNVSVDASRMVMVPNPVAVRPDLPIWPFIQDATFPAVFALLIVGVARLVLRFRRSRGLERLQLRWLVAAIVFVLVGVAFGIGWIIIFGDQFAGYGWIVAIVAYPTIPLAVGVAVMRYRLLEIDRIISRTLSYAAVTAILGAVFVGAILLSQTLLSGITGNRGIPVAISTLAVFALFQPLLRRVRRAVDRRFDRARYDAERTAEAFAERLRWETDMERVSGDLRATVASAVAPVALAIWLRAGRPTR